MVFYVFIAYSIKNTLCALSVTTDLKRRLKLLKLNQPECTKIVYYEEYDNSLEATKRETFLKKLPKELIHELVLDNNPMLTEIELNNLTH